MVKFKYYYILKFINKYLLPLLIFISVIAVVLLIGYTFFYTDFKIQDKITIAIAGFASLGILIAYKQITINADLQRKRLSLEITQTITQSNKNHRDILNRLMDYSNLFPTAYLQYESFTISEIKKQLYDDDNDIKMSKRGRKINSHIIAILNNFEMLSIGVANNVYDEEIIKEYFNDIVKSNYEVLRHFITYQRETLIYNDLCCNFEWLYNEWNKDNIINKDKR